MVRRVANKRENVMKIKGKTLDKPQNEIVVIPRGEEDFVFEAQAVLDFSEFDRVCPEPSKRAVKNQKTGEVTYKDPDMSDYSSKRFSYMVIKSLEATPDLEWDNIDIEKPETYEQYEKELRDFGLTDREMVLVIQAVSKVNGLTNEIYEEAKKRFLATQSH
jgi:hypothetical protein